MYLASAALDNEIVVWDLHTKEKLAGHSSEATPLSLVWKPEGNALMCATAAGKLQLWEDCIPDGHPGPLEVAESPVKALSPSGNASGRALGPGPAQTPAITTLFDEKYLYDSSRL